MAVGGMDVPALAGAHRTLRFRGTTVENHSALQPLAKMGQVDEQDYERWLKA